MSTTLRTKADIKGMVAGDRTVAFTHYRQGELWYVTQCGFPFPVPVADTGDGVFLHQDRAMFFMRYIRQQVEAIAQGHAETAAA